MATAGIKPIDPTHQAVDLASQGVDDDAALHRVGLACRRCNIPAHASPCRLRETAGVHADHALNRIMGNRIEPVFDSHAPHVADRVPHQPGSNGLAYASNNRVDSASLQRVAASSAGRVCFRFVRDVECRQHIRSARIDRRIIERDNPADRRP